MTDTLKQNRTTPIICAVKIVDVQNVHLLFLYLSFGINLISSLETETLSQEMLTPFFSEILNCNMIIVNVIFMVLTKKNQNIYSI